MSTKALQTYVEEKIKSLDVSRIKRFTGKLEFYSKKGIKTVSIKMKDGKLVSVAEFICMKKYLSKTDR